MVENVDENVDFPRTRVAEIALAEGAARPFPKESEHNRQIAGHPAGIVIGKRAQMPRACELERQGSVLSVRSEKSSPEPGENEGRDIEQAGLVALDKGENLHFGKAAVRAFARCGMGRIGLQNYEQRTRPKRGARRGGVRIGEEGAESRLRGGFMREAPE